MVLLEEVIPAEVSIEPFLHRQVIGFEAVVKHEPPLGIVIRYDFESARFHNHTDYQNRSPPSRGSAVRSEEMNAEAAKR